MSNDEMFRKYIYDLTNNGPMTDMICQLNTATSQRNECPEHPELNDDELFAASLYEAVPMIDLVETICHIRDVIYGDGSIKLDVDPSYQDAEVYEEAKPKQPTLFVSFASAPQMRDMGEDIRAMKESYRSRVMDPLGDIARKAFDNKSELEKLAVMPVEPSPYYNRF